jgi:hypothetical protein
MRKLRNDTSLDLFAYTPEYLGEYRDDIALQNIRESIREKRMLELGIKEHERKARLAEFAKPRAGVGPYFEHGVKGVRYYTPVKSLPFPSPTKHRTHYRKTI